MTVISPYYAGTSFLLHSPFFHSDGCSISREAVKLETSKQDIAIIAVFPPFARQSRVALF